MYFVERKKIEETLIYMEKLLKEVSRHKYETFMEKLYLERTVHMVIESILDVGNMMIDGFIMRDPGSYEDIIDILVDEKVIPESEQSCYKELILLRKTLVKDYIKVDHALLDRTIQENKDKLNQFSSHIRSYLDNELGVANAFAKE
ncbi:DUF86 domain-containing protein [Virgibacillus litoralis]|uniref:Uncharacterized protein YutE (UPF0331/DUF86 family) n=1 Tax=Virgibacillus litoralis TaxID=578221 RepID=A0ABS4HGQ9_9BACI|nr:DUF86 domain-containing protein [Virgibacillus litoralis]MBP1950111.1 uncharacterized protein YutE (UPF0331/DUF86 family) [Virgibacillus litoralis]